MKGFRAYAGLVMEYLTAACAVPGHPDAADVLDKAEFYLGGAEIEARLPGEHDLIRALRELITALSDRNEQAAALFEELGADLVEE